jgi:hypothetical protein
MAKVSATTQNFIPIKNIRPLDPREPKRGGVVILKNGSLRMVLMVSSVNFALKSQDEQMGTLLPSSESTVVPRGSSTRQKN